MKKFHRSISFFLAASVVLTMFCLSGCNKNETSEVETSSSSITENTTVESTTTESTTTESTTESTTVESTTAESTTEETTESETSESTTAETSESTESTTEPSFTSAPDKGSSSGVKVHWDIYEESNHPAPVVHRLREERIDDFIPSSDYGYVMPFCAALGEKQYEDDDEFIKRYGFIDAKGRLICDGVFCSYTPLTKGYIVNRTVPSTSGGTENWCSGYISKDGSFYTGTLYDDTSVDDDDLFLIRYASDTLTYKVLNMTSGKLSEERTLKINGIRESRESEEYFYYDYIKIVENRYIICVGESLTVSGVCDGMTGKMVDFPIDKEDWHRATLYENTLYDYRYDFDDDSKTSGFLYSASGELLYETKIVDRISDSSLLVRLPDSLVVLDKNGKLISTFPTDSIATIEDIRNAGDYLLLWTQKGLEIYDIEFKHIRSIPEVTNMNYSLIYDYQNLKADSFVCPCDNNGDYSTFIINIRTGEKIETGDASNCSIISGTSFLLLEFQSSDYDKHSFKIIDAKDGSVLYEGEMSNTSYTDSYYDEAKSLAYLCITDFGEKTPKILDLSSMQYQFNGEDSIPSGFWYLDWISEGAALLSSSGKRETCMIDRDGKITFLYYPMVFDD